MVKKQIFGTGLVNPFMGVLVTLMLLFGVSLSTALAATPKATLTFWHYWTDRQALMEDMAARYEKATGVRVKMELYGGDAYAQKLQAAAQANALPDIIGWTGGGGEKLARYINAGYILDLSDELKAGWKERFYDAYIDQFTYKAGNEWKVKPGIYGVPLDANNMQFLYNKDLFKKAGLDPDKVPETWAEFLAIGKKLKAAGITPVVAGFGSWAQYALHDTYAWQIVGKEKMEETFRGKLSYTTTPEWEKVLGVFAEMRDADILPRGIASLSVPDSERIFVNGQAAIIFNGSWAIGVFNSMNPQFKNYGVFMPPKHPEGKYPVLIPGGMGASIVMNAKSPYKKEAVAFVKWFTDKLQQARYASESFNLPANKLAVNPELLTLQLAQFADDMDKVFPALSVYENGQVQDILGKGIQSILIDEKTPKQVLKEMQDAKEKLK